MRITNFQLSKTEYQNSLAEDALNDPTELRKNRIRELEAENAEMPDLRRKISEFDAEKTELKHRIAEALKMTEEERTRRDAENAKHKARIEELESEFRDRIMKVEQKQTLNDNSSNNNSSNFNLVADQVPMSPLESDSPSSINYNNVNEVSETACSEKVTYSIDEVSQHLAQLCDKAIDAEDRANQANQEEILCWCLYWKDFRDQLNEIIRSNSGKFGEKKVRSMLYDTFAKKKITRIGAKS
ncbi:uncharacterized protein OCT59_014695 [Rhizophagus irregularis]|uniref:uncharacterized protein n=1 Tax=Rhizophagus irregularis TaxID=588596 RepID=UPI00332C1466|nr:hypothetical protein OCT59_014695 [Rhizophagus irregularis]